MNSRFKSTGGKEIEEKCPVRIYVIEITYILTGQDIYWRFKVPLWHLKTKVQ